MNYFELYPGDYLRDTSRLSLVEHGAYLRLLMAYYAEEDPLPADLGELYVIACATSAADKAAVRKVADRYFPVGGDGLRRNGRADEEIARAQSRMAEAAGRRAEKKGNETERQRRTRARRTKLFSDLRAVGVVPDGLATMEELKALHVAHVTRDAAVTDMVVSRVTERDSHGVNTAIQTPDPSIPPDRFSEGTRDARPPAEPEVAGTFEGHDDPRPGPPNPVVPFAVALNAAGVRCTALNPDLVAYVAEGGTVEHLLAIAEQCPGKPVRYVASFARRELADRAVEVTATANGPPHNGATSKSVQALTALEALKSHDALDPHRDRDRPAKAAPALAGPHPVR